MPDTYGESTAATTVRTSQELIKTLDAYETRFKWADHELAKWQMEWLERIQKIIDKSSWPARGEHVQECG